MEQSMEILVVEPGEEPRMETLECTIEAMEEKLGGEVKIGCLLPQRVMLISRSDTEGLKLNRSIPGEQEPVRGTILLCGIPEDGNRFVSLTPAQRAELEQLFAGQGEFMSVGDTVYSDPDDVADAVYGLWESMKDGETVVLTKTGGRGK